MTLTQVYDPRTVIAAKALAAAMNRGNTKDWKLWQGEARAVLNAIDEVKK